VLGRGQPVARLAVGHPVEGAAVAPLLDWDHAGPTLAAGELLITALSFAGSCATRPTTGWPGAWPPGSSAPSPPTPVAIDRWAGRLAQAMWMV